LHRLQAFARTRAAYDASLALEPGQARTLLYRGEVLARLGETAAAGADLGAAERSPDRAVARRARELRHIVGAGARAPGPSGGRRTVGAADPTGQAQGHADDTAPGFVLHDARALPLVESGEAERAAEHLSVAYRLFESAGNAAAAVRVLAYGN
jgi:hypothetical protein